jgi:hypothetical protein
MIIITIQPLSLSSFIDGKEERQKQKRKRNEDPFFFAR